jgi:5-(carboxyamino)imidazole ribonucleotide synthase
MLAHLPPPLPPGATIGILGGGQLGRMLVLAAARLGYRACVFSPEACAPAAQVTNRVVIAAYDDKPALARFAAEADVVTYEFENIPFATATVVADRALVRPSPEVLAICQDRNREKAFLARIGAPVAENVPVTDAADLVTAVGRIGRPAVLKSARFGYDGKGQVRIDDTTDLTAAWADMRSASDTASGPAGILEAWVDFALEISVIVARSVSGETKAFVPVQNIHEHHILRRTIAPAPIAAPVAAAALDLAHGLARAIGLVGVLAIEMFVGRDGRLLVNELAPRPHNSGHWTIDACPTSQFEQCVRAITGLPLGPTAPFADAVMDNLLGAEADDWLKIAAEPGARLHLYGKDSTRPGRKMGHVTRLTAHRRTDQG